MSTLGKQIQQARTEKNITRKVLARKTGLSEKNIIDIETGSKIVNTEILKTLSKALETDFVDHQFTLASQMTKEEKEKMVPSPPEKAENMQDMAFSFGRLVHSVHIYDYDLIQVWGKIAVALSDNKIEGHAKDKIFILKIKNQKMRGFRICEGDLLMMYRNTQVLDQAISLIRYRNDFMLCKVKKLDPNNLLLLFHQDEPLSQTLPIKEVEILGHAIKNTFYLK